MKKESQDSVKLLFEGLRHHDQKAFEKIYSHYFGNVYNTILFLVRRHSLAEELTQQVFIKIWDKRESIRIYTSPDSYIKRLCKNLVYDYFKKLKSEKLSCLEENLDHHFIHNDLEEMIDHNELEVQILNVISKLPPSQREIFNLSRFQGLKNDEIADQMNLSKRTVEHQLYRALQKIKKSIGEYAHPTIILIISLVFL